MELHRIARLRSRALLGGAAILTALVVCTSPALAAAPTTDTSVPDSAALEPNPAVEPPYPDAVTAPPERDPNGLEAVATASGVAGVSASAAGTVTTPAGELPFTGAETWIAAFVGALLLAAGSALHVGAQRVRRS